MEREEKGAGMTPDSLTTGAVSLLPETHSVTWEFLFLPEHEDLVPKLHTFLNQVEKQYHLGRIL